LGTTRLVTSGNTSVDFNVTTYTPIGTQLNLRTTEAWFEKTFRQSGTLANLYARVPTNTIATSATTARLRKNLANFSPDISASIGAGATGIFEDLTNSATIAAGDEADYQIITPNTSGSITFYVISCTFASDTNTYGYFGGALGTQYDDATTRYSEFAGQTINNTTEAPTQLRIRTAGTLKHGFCYVQANDTSPASTLRTRKNLADGGITVSITANTTGIFEDTSGTDTVAAGDDFAFQVVVPTQGGAHSINIQHMSVGFETTNNQFELGGVNFSGIAQTNNVTRYHSIGGTLISGSTTENTDLTVRLSNLTAKEVSCELTANTFTTLATTVNLRQNTTNAIALSIAAAATGFFSQTGSVSYATTDETNYQIITPNQAGSITIQQLSSVWDVTPVTVTVAQWMPALRPYIYKQYIPEWQRARKLEGVRTPENPKYNTWIILIRKLASIIPAIQPYIYKQYIPNWSEDRRQEKRGRRTTPKYNAWEFLFKLFRNPIYNTPYEQYEPVWLKDKKRQTRERRTTPKYSQWEFLLKLFRKKIYDPPKIYRKREPINQPNPKYELWINLINLLKQAAILPSPKQVIRKRFPTNKPNPRFDSWEAILEVVLAAPLISHVWNLYKIYLPEWNRKRKRERIRITPTPKFTFWQFLFNLFKIPITTPKKIYRKREPVNKPNPKYMMWQNLITLLKNIQKPKPLIVKREPFVTPTPKFDAWKELLAIVTVPLIRYIWNPYKAYIPTWLRKDKREIIRIQENPKYSSWEFLFRLLIIQKVKPTPHVVKRDPVLRPNPKYTVWENLIKLLKGVSAIQQRRQWIVKREPKVTTTPRFDAWKEILVALTVPLIRYTQTLYYRYIPTWIGKRKLERARVKPTPDYDVWFNLIKLLRKEIFKPIYARYLPTRIRKDKRQIIRVTPTLEYTFWANLLRILRKEIYKPKKVIVKREPIIRPNPKYTMWANLLRILRRTIKTQPRVIVKREPVLRPNPRFTAWKAIFVVVATPLISYPWSFYQKYISIWNKKRKEIKLGHPVNPRYDAWSRDIANIIAKMWGGGIRPPWKQPKESPWDASMKEWKQKKDWKKNRNKPD